MTEEYVCHTTTCNQILLHKRKTRVFSGKKRVCYASEITR